MKSPTETEPLPLSLLNDYLYCPRRAALKIVEGWRETNVHTDRGDIVHEHADLAGYEVVKGVKLLRALPVFSERLGLNGKCDIVEVHPLTRPADTLSPTQGEEPLQLCHRHLRQPPADTLAPTGGEGRGEGASGTLLPVEFKVGKRRPWENDDAQLCAQALCLEEMFGVAVPRGAVFHADSKRRREVTFTPELRQLTENAVAELHRLLDHASIPPAVFKEACEACSLYDICLPKATGADSRAGRLARQLFET